MFALAWYARCCVDYKWDVKETLDYQKLINAGYTEADFERLAKYTYLPVPRISTQNEDSINDIAIFAIDLLQSRAEDFHIAYLADQQRRAANVKARAGATDNGSFTSSTIPSATYAETKAAASKGRKRIWLSAIGRALNVAGAVASGQNIASALTQSVSNGTAGNAGNSVNAAMAQAFNYSGEQRKGQQDFNGRIIRNELTTPCAYGQVHYTWYEDGYCLAYSVSTCVGCYGKKICTICQGQGRTFNSYLKSYKQCPACLGSGRCKYCQGVGHQTMSKLWAPGESEAYLSAKHEVDDEPSSSSSSSSSSSQSGVCSNCNGKGYEPKAYTYAAQSRYAPYHNSAGTSCYICGKSTDHYHYRCLQCKRN